MTDFAHAPATHISYDACGTFYTVRVLCNTETVDEYTGGNSPFESTSIVPADYPYAVSADMLLQFAEQTAGEMAEEYEIEKHKVERDEDLLAEEREAEKEADESN